MYLFSIVCLALGSLFMYVYISSFLYLSREFVLSLFRYIVICLVRSLFLYLSLPSVLYLYRFCFFKFCVYLLIYGCISSLLVVFMYIFL